MRLLGKCPWCFREDTVSSTTSGESIDSEVSCSGCRTRWDHWQQVVVQARQKNVRLIPVSIDRKQFSVIITQPRKADIPCVNLVVLAFNRTLRIMFGLGKCHVIEEGVEGIYEGEPIELRNTYDWIGLEDEHRFADVADDPRASDRCQEILGHYELLLRMLLGEEELIVGRERTRGAILKLGAQDPCREEKVKLLLWCVIQRCAGGKIVDGVFRQLGWQVSQAALAGLYAAGMSETEIAKLFWLRESVAQKS